jgi:hypothetical protein
MNDHDVFIVKKSWKFGGKGVFTTIPIEKGTVIEMTERTLFFMKDADFFEPCPVNANNCRAQYDRWSERFHNTSNNCRQVKSEKGLYIEILRDVYPGDEMTKRHPLSYWPKHMYTMLLLSNPSKLEKLKYKWKFSNFREELKIIDKFDKQGTLKLIKTHL